MEMTLIYLNLGNMHQLKGELDEAAAKFGIMADMLSGLDPAYPRVLELSLSLTNVYTDLVRQFAANRPLQQLTTLSEPLLALQKQLAGARPEAPDTTVELGGASCNVGIALTTLRQTDAAFISFDRAIYTLRGVLAKDKRHAAARDFLANSYTAQGSLYAQTDQQDQAEQSYRLALAVREELVRDFQNYPDYRFRLANVHGNLALLHQRAGQTEQAETWCRHAFDVQQKLAADFPRMSQYQTALVATCDQLARLYVKLKKLDDSLPVAEQELQAYRRLVELLPAQKPTYQLGLARTQRKLGELYLVKKSPAQALPAFAEAVALFGEMLSAPPPPQAKPGAKPRSKPAKVKSAKMKPADANTLRSELAQTCAGLARAHTANDDADAAQAALDQTAQTIDGLEPKSAAVPICQATLVQACVGLGNQCLKERRGDMALAAYRRAQEPVRALLTAKPEVTTYQDYALAVFGNAGAVHAAAGRHEEALAAFRQLAALVEPIDRNRPPVIAACVAMVKNLDNLGDSLRQAGAA